MSDPKENKTNWFPEGSDIKCFVIFLDFHFNSNKRITGANENEPKQSTRYLQQHKFNSENHWMNDLQTKVLSLYHMHFFPPLAAVFLLGTSGITLKIVAF